MLRKLTIALLVGGIFAATITEASAYRGFGGRGWGGRGGFAGGWNRGGWGRGWGGGWGWGGVGLGLGLGALAYDAYPYSDYGYYGSSSYPAYTTAYRYGGCW
ncbi:MAG: hypothetical protein WBS22_09755 [Methylocystis sp.]